MDGHRIGAIVVAYNSEEHILACIESLRSELSEPDGIVVVDNDSQDGTIARLEEYTGQPPVTLIINHENVGFGAAVNLASETMKGCDFYLVVNPDLRVMPGAVREMMDYMSENPDCGAVGPGIQDESGRMMPSSFAFSTLEAELLKLTGVAKLVPLSLRRTIARAGGRFLGSMLGTYFSSYAAAPKSRPVDWVSGACVLVRRDSLGEDSLFDDRFFLYYEDQDLCLRLRKKGHSTGYVASARAVHTCHGSTGGARSAFCMNHDTKSMFLYYEKHASRTTVIALATAGALAAAVVALVVPFGALRKGGLRPVEKVSVCRCLFSSSISAFRQALSARPEQAAKIHITDGGGLHDAKSA